MAATLHTVKLKGPVTVAYRKVKGLHVRNALEFDIAGTGDRREAAFTEMKELLAEYLFFVVKRLGEGRKVRFFNPADRDEWNNSQSLAGSWSIGFKACR